MFNKQKQKPHSEEGHGLVYLISVFLIIAYEDIRTVKEIAQHQIPFVHLPDFLKQVIFPLSKDNFQATEVARQTLKSGIITSDEDPKTNTITQIAWQLVPSV